MEVNQMGHSNGPFSMRKVLLGLSGATLILLLLSVPSPGAVITRLPTHEKAVALTFDACETITPAYFDMPLLNYLLKERLPFTLFLSGRFALEPVNALVIRQLSRNPWVEIENHSFSHVLHMERLPDRRVQEEVLQAQRLLIRLTGRKPRFFRFPGGYRTVERWPWLRSWATGWFAGPSPAEIPIETSLHCD